MSIQKSKWTPAEDEAFSKALDTFKPGEWEEIAKAIGSKTIEQVKYRSKYLMRSKSGDSELSKKLADFKSSAKATPVPVQSKTQSPKKRSYTRRQTKPVPVEEEISIISSSSSSTPALSEASNASINIMSSSSSSASLKSIKSEKSSSWSTASSEASAESKSSKKSTSSKKSNASAASTDSKATKASISSNVSKASSASKTSVGSNPSIASKASTSSKASIASKTSTKSKESVNFEESKISKESITSAKSSSTTTAKKTTAAKIPAKAPAKESVKAPAEAKVTKAAPVKRLGMTGRRTKAVINKAEASEPVAESKSIAAENGHSTNAELSNEAKQLVTNTEPLSQIVSQPSTQPIISQSTEPLTQPIISQSTEPSTPRPVTSSTPKQSSKKTKRPVDDFDQEEFDSEAEAIRKLATGSARRRKIRSEDGDWIDPVELEGRTIDHQPPPPPEPKRKRKYTRKVVEDADDPFRLIWLNDYSVEADAEEDERAPFRVEIDISVLCLLDFHSHLFSTEIIGLLGGRFDDSSRLLRISTVFPCKSSHSTGTEVDVDPLSEMEAGEHFERSGVRMIGWYHSHPNFEPNPSLRDLETQTMYQGLCRSVDGGLEAFVGIIVNPYLAVTESSSHIECFYVAQSNESGLERLPFRLPMQMTGQLNEELLLAEMRRLVEACATASDALDMQKNAERGVKRVDKLLKSLSTHAQLSESHSFLLQVQQLFGRLGANVLERTEEDYSF